MTAHLLIIESRFYTEIADMLLAGAVAEINKTDTSYDIVSVPGCFEIPAALSMAAGTYAYDGYILLGCVIRGETSHYDVVCNETMRGINTLAIDLEIPLGVGILTTENYAQAVERADILRKNKGAAAAIAALHMIGLRDFFLNSLSFANDQ